MMQPVAEQGLDALRYGEIQVKGEFLWGSNYTFLVEISHADKQMMGVYKPTRGERPLWDFPAASLAKREAAAYLVSEALGWNFVPPTIYRKKAPLGPGSLQQFIDHDSDYHYFTFSEEDLQRLRPVALFDIIVNNADRKGSHILFGPDRHLWLIDHGVCFHVEEKLRTVIWDFVGEPIPDSLCGAISNFYEKLAYKDHNQSNLANQLGSYLNQAEVRALAKRAWNLVVKREFPNPDPSRRPYPWPQI